MSFWLSSDNKNSPQGITLHDGIILLPLPQKFDLISAGTQFAGGSSESEFWRILVAKLTHYSNIMPTPTTHNPPNHHFPPLESAQVRELELLQCPVHLSLGKKWGISLRPRDISRVHRNKTRFMLLYYSYSRPLREARGSHCHP